LASFHFDRADTAMEQDQRLPRTVNVVVQLETVDLSVAGNTESEARHSYTAHYGEFVQWERRKANGRFGAKRTGISVMPHGLEQRSCVEAMSMIDVELVG
jgi:hypothetical protein